MTAIKTIKFDTTTTARIDGRKVGHAPIKATPWVSELGAPDMGDGILGIDADFSAVVQHIRGWAVRLTIDKPPAYNLLQAQRVKVTAICVYDGILCETSDINLDAPRVCSFRGIGTWLKGGNCWEIGGHKYGGDIGTRIGGDPNISGKCGMVATQNNDCRIGVEILHPVVMTGCEAKQCWGHGVLAKAKTRMDNCSIGAYASNAGDSTGYVGLEFTPQANWSSFRNGGVIIGSGATGIIADAEFLTIDADFEGRGNATALRVTNPIGQANITVRQSGCPGGVVLEKLGWNNRINIWSMLPNYTLPPAGWSKRNNEIRFNGTLLEDK